MVCVLHHLDELEHEEVQKPAQLKQGDLEGTAPRESAVHLGSDVREVSEPTEPEVSGEIGSTVAQADPKI